jgi:ankyrin repeat protein
VVDAAFIRESNSETLVACLEGTEGEGFLTERNFELATVLHLAVETDKDRLVLDAIRRAASEGWPDLRDRLDNDGRTALHIAAETGESADTVRLLLNWGADPNARYAVENRWNPFSSDYGITPLHLAAMRANGANVVSALLASGADPTIARPIKPKKEGQDYWPAVLIASRYAEDLRVLTALAAGGADLNAVSNDDNNALHVAAAWDRPHSVIRFLHESGVDANATNDEGQTPLHLATLFSTNPETVVRLLEVTDDPCAADTKERTARELLKDNEALAGNHGLERRFHEICVEGK